MGTAGAIAFGMRDLRRTLATIVVSAPLVGCVISGHSQTCPNVDEGKTDDTFAIDHDDATLATVVAKCEQQNDCHDLCDALYVMKYGLDNVVFDTCELVSGGGEHLHVVAHLECVGGRRPGNYRRGIGDVTCNAVGRFLADQADLEAASVRAFADVYADLVELGAPADIRRAVIRAAADEVRHAQVCARLARRYGATAVLRRSSPAPRRSLHAFAIDNAIEGCVRETFGAAVAGYQARTAGDPLVRRAMYRIARDEAKHAALAWRIQRWLLPRLGVEDRRTMLAASTAARVELSTTMLVRDPTLVQTLGLPAPAAATAMLADLDTRVWSPLAWRA
jgi:hypothetical protein